MIPTFNYLWNDEMVRKVRSASRLFVIKTRLLNARFIHEFFKNNEDLATNPWYIAGVSYAGVYVPEMAAQVESNIKVLFNLVDRLSST